MAESDTPKSKCQKFVFKPQIITKVLELFLENSRPTKI